MRPLLGTAAGSSGAGHPLVGHPPVAARSRADISRSFARLPLRCEANRGQASGSVDFLARGLGYTMELGRSTDFPTKNAEQPANASASGPNNYDSFVTKAEPLRLRPDLLDLSRGSAARRHIAGPGALFTLQIGGFVVAGANWL